MVQFGVLLFFFFCLAEMTKIILFCIRIALINILLSFFRQYCHPPLSFLWYFTKYPLSLLTTQNSRNYSKKNLSYLRVFYSSVEMFWSAITVHRNSFRFVFHWRHRSVAVHKVGSVGQEEWEGWERQQLGTAGPQSSGGSRGSFFALIFSYMNQEEKNLLK